MRGIRRLRFRVGKARRRFRFRLEIATRADPPLPVFRLRVRNQLTELRVDDLRFTVDEATAFLNEMMGLELTPENVAVLETRTEGCL
jgi:LuxR family maltose regulon positive regulatory protein